MAKTTKKTIGAAMAGVMAVGAVAGAVNAVDQVKVANAAESQALKDAKAKISHLTWSLKNNYLGLKNQAQWEVYIKEARVLIGKIPTAEKAEATALTDEVNRAQELVNALARINHVEKSMDVNFHGIKNAKQWNEYLKLGEEALKEVNKEIFADQYAELVERLGKCASVVDKIVDEFKVEYDAAVKLFDAAKTSMNIEDAKKALEAAEKLGTCEESDKLEEDIKSLIDEIENAVAAVKSAEAINAKELVVKFNKPVNKDEVAAAVKIVNAGSEITFTLAEESKDDKTFTLTASSLMNVEAGTLTIEPVSTKADKNVKTAKHVSLFTYKDTVAPAVAKVDAKDKKAVITFDEEIQAGATVSVNGYNYSDITISGKTLTINGLEDGKRYNVQIVGAKDASNNIANPIDLSFTVEKADEVADQTVSTSVKENIVTLQFTNALSSSNVAKVLFVDGKAHNTAALELNGAAVAGITYSEDKKTVTLDAQELGVLGSLSFLNTEIKISDAGLKEAVTVDARISADKIAAKLVSTETNAAGEVTLEFNEEVKIPTGNKISLKVTSIDGIYQSTPVAWDDLAVAYAADKDGKQIKNKLVITVGDKADVNKNYTVEVPAGINDKYDNASEKFNISVVKPEMDNTVKPEAKITATTTINKNIVKISFTNLAADKNLTSEATNPSNYTLGGKALPEGTIVRFVDNKKTVEIVLPEGAIVTNGNYTLKMKNIKDEIGNTLKDGEESKVISLVENVAPTAKTIKITSSEIATITFSEALQHEDENSNSAIDGITIKVNNEVVSGTTLELSSDGMTLKISGLSLKDSDKVTVEFKNAELVDKSINKNQLKDTAINS